TEHAEKITLFSNSIHTGPRLIGGLNPQKRHSVYTFDPLGQITRDPNRDGLRRKSAQSGALSIGRFVISRWLSAGLRGIECRNSLFGRMPARLRIDAIRKERP